MEDQDPKHVRRVRYKGTHPKTFKEKYKELQPDIVTMDITMPKMDGVTSLEKIIEFDKNAKVIMISALGKQDLVKKSLLLGAKNYIVKPLDRKKVLERIVMTLKK